MMKRSSAAVILLACVSLGSTGVAKDQSLHVSGNRRFLVKEDGEAFFWLGDTAWELFHRLDREEAEMYLKDRARKGFTVIQAVALAEINGLKRPNPYGHLPLVDEDPTQPVEAYFEHVEWVVKKAEELGLVVALLPTWGDKWQVASFASDSHIIFTPENAEVYGRWIAKRYKDQKNIVWILGGDRNPDSTETLAIIRSMAAGLREGDGGNHLISFHPMGGNCSSKWFHDDDWLDFNLFQSGHGGPDYPNYEFTQRGYRLQPIKPVIDGEPRYEDLPVAFNPENGRHSALDVRQAAYWSVLAGAFGHTYGNNNVWQMWQSGRKPRIWARSPWYEALHHPGACEMGFVRRLFESRPFLKLVPAQGAVSVSHGQEQRFIRAARGSDGSYLFVYSTFGEGFRVDLSKISGEQINACWYSPREGTGKPIGTFANTCESKTFLPPSQGRNNDWVLVLDDASLGYPPPGKN